MPAPTSKAKDPVQMKLREYKRKWNSSYKDFSQRLKAVKDGLNGRGNAKMNIPPSNLKNPLPSEIGASLSQLAGDFQQLIGDAGSIVNEQGSYSQNRKKPQQKTQIQAPAVQPIEDANPLARIGSVDFSIEKESSNKFTRGLQYLSGFFSRKEFNKQRLGLLSQSADLYYSLLNLENDILTLNISNIPNTIAKFTTFKYSFDALSDTFSNVVGLVANKAKTDSPLPSDNSTQSSGKPIQKVKQKQPSLPEVSEEELQKIKEDLHKLFNAKLVDKEIIHINSMFQELEAETDPQMKSMWKSKIKDSYAALVNEVAEKIRQKNKESSAELVSEFILKNSHNSMTRFLKKQLVKAAPSNKTANVRLEAVKITNNIKILIINIMDSLEKHLSIEDIKGNISKIDVYILSLKKQLHILNLFYKEEFFSKKDKSQIGKEDKLMNLVMQRKLRKELSEDLE